MFFFYLMLLGHFIILTILLPYHFFLYILLKKCDMKVNCEQETYYKALIFVWCVSFDIDMHACHYRGVSNPYNIKLLQDTQYIHTNTYREARITHYMCLCDATIRDIKQALYGIKISHGTSLIEVINPSSTSLHIILVVFLYNMV